RNINRSNTFTLYDERVGVMAAITSGRDYRVLVDPVKVEEDPFTLRKIQQHQKAAGLGEAEIIDPQLMKNRTLDIAANTLTGGGRWSNSIFDVLFIDSPENMGDLAEGLDLDAIVLHDMEKIPEQLLERSAEVAKTIVLAGK